MSRARRASLAVRHRLTGPEITPASTWARGGLARYGATGSPHSFGSQQNAALAVGS